MGDHSLYKNLIFFLITLVSLNLAIGFYKGISKSYKKQSERVNYSILGQEGSKKYTSKETVDFINEANEMIGIFQKYNFSVDSFLSNQKSNFIIFSSLPKDFMSIEPIKERKNLFINTLLPIIFVENKKIIDDRKKILEWWRESDGDVYSRDFWPSWLFELSEKYDSEEANLGNLLMRVDVVPISLALAQAAIESGWGKSRFAKEYNALFGEYTYDQNKGVVPLKRNIGDKHLIKSFSSYDNSVSSYFKNINSHFAYKEFRDVRNVMRIKNNFSNINLLVGKLNSYAEDDKYVDTLNLVIKKNRFDKFDSKIISY